MFERAPHVDLVCASTRMVDSISQDRFRSTLNRAMLVPIIAMVVIAVVYAALVERLVDAQEWLDHTDIVISRIYEAQKILIGAESGLRGFQLTGDRSYLASFEAARLSVPKGIDELRSLTIDNARQTPRADELREETSRWFEPEHRARDRARARARWTDRRHEQRTRRSPRGDAHPRRDARRGGRSACRPRQDHPGHGPLRAEHHRAVGHLSRPRPRLADAPAARRALLVLW